MLGAGKNTIEIILAARDRTRGAFVKVKAQMKGLEGVGSKLTKTFKNVAKAGAAVGAAAVIAGIAGSTKAFMDFEDAMANVRKTTGFTKEQIGVLGDAINDMALRIPVAQTELAGIAAVAGQLGITGQKNILDFTETAAKMSTAFDMSAESVAIAAAKLSNIYDIPIEQVSNLGSAINALGNTTAASESQILDFSMALGASAKMLGFGETEAVAMGASLVSMGMDASAAGTRLNSAFTQMGKNVDKVSKLLEISEEQFKAGFGEDPMNMLIRIITKLGEIKDPLERNTMAAETFGLIGAKAIVNLGANVDGLKTNLKTSATEFENNTSLTEEFAAKTDTLKAKFQLLKNSITSLLIDIGGELAPSIETIINGFKSILPAVKEVLFELGAGFKEMFESISRQAGPALEPLIKKLKEAGTKISAGLDFKTLADDVGVFIGAALRPLIDAFGWLIDKLGPLWELIGKGAEVFHNLANALKTEEGRLDDILDATEEVTAAKLALFDINGKLSDATKALAEQLESAGAWTSSLTDLEVKAKTGMAALAEARKKASEAIAEHGVESEIAKTAIEHVKQAEDAATIATRNFNTALSDAAQELIDSDVATDELHKAQLDFITSTEDAITVQEDLEIAVANLERELEEAKQAPFNLGETFGEFGKKVKAVFAEIPLRIAESFEKLNKISSDIFSELGKLLTDFGESLPSFLGDGIEKIGKTFLDMGDNFSLTATNIQQRAADIRDSFTDNIKNPLEEEIPIASKKTEEAILNASKAIILDSEKVAEKINETNEVLKETGIIAIDAGEVSEAAFEGIESQAAETKITIKSLNGELKENINTFEDMSEVATKLIDLDWMVFSEFEATLPDIRKGIGDMESAFRGLKVVLEENIEELTSVKQSVMAIGDITAPFLEAGFLDGIKAIGSFAGALQDAGSAINAFGNLAEANIEGCVNFSRNIYGMVSALEILDSQMEDLVPAFGDMDSLITGIADAFLYGGDKAAGFFDSFDSAISSSKGILDSGAENFNEFKEIVEKALDVGELTYLADTYITESDSFQKKWKTITVENAKDVERAMHGWLGGFTSEFETTVGTITSGTEEISDTYRNATMHLHNWVLETYGVRISQGKLYEVMQSPPEEQKKWLDEIMHSEKALTFQMDKQTNALKAQTEQLAKITNALEPYLSFLGTLTTISELGTISTEDLSSGFEAIIDTITNLSSVLLKLDFETAFSKLFDAEGTEDFFDTMTTYTPKLSILTGFIKSLGDSVTTLSESFSTMATLDIVFDQGSFTKNLELVMGGVKDLIAFIDELVPALEGMYTSDTANMLSVFIADIENVIQSFVDLENKLKITMDAIKREISNSVNSMDTKINTLSKLANNSFTWGANLMTGFINGIYSMSDALTTAVAQQAMIVDDYLGASSPTRVGPLSHLDEWPRNLIQSYSAGIESEMHTLNSSFAGLAPGMGAASPAGGNKTFHLHLTQNIGNRSDAMYSVDEIKRLMIRHEVM